MSTTEIILEVSEDDMDGGYPECALGYGTHTEEDSVEAFRRNVKEAVEFYSDEAMSRP